MKNTLLSIVIPCFNEAENVKLVIDRLHDLMQKNPDLNFEVLIVDGASSDGTQDVLKEHTAALGNPRFKLIFQQKRGGYGKDIMAGLKQASGEVLCWTHADMQTDPLDVLKAFRMYLDLNNEKIFIKGKRKNRRLIEAFFTFGMQIVSWAVLKVYLSDINAQPKMFSRKFYQEYLISNPPDDFSLDLFALYGAKQEGYQIKTIDVYFAKRLHGEAKGGGSWQGRLRLIKRTFAYIFKLKEQLKS